MLSARRPLEAPRFSDAPPGRGHYESFYVTAMEPGGGRAVWARHTILKRPDDRPRQTLWLTAFTAGGGAVATRETLDDPLLTDRPWLRCADAEVGPGGARGAAGAARWDLRLDGGEEALPYLPARRLYDAALPQTKAVALHPRVAVSGSVTDAQGTAWELDAWDGMLGHNWGAEHAEHWIWVHAALPGGDWFDLALARTRLGPVLAPWLGGGGLRLDGRLVRLGGPRGRPRVEIRGEGVDLDVPAGRSRLRVRARYDPAATVHWEYASPSGASRQVDNSSVSDLELELEGRRIHAERSCALEVGTPT